jgi:hypothetical protein
MQFGHCGERTGHAILVEFMGQLSSLAHAHSITILVRTYFLAKRITIKLFCPKIVNTSTTSETYDPISAFPVLRKPSLGPSFQFMCAGTLWVQDARDVVDNIQLEENEDLLVIAEVAKSIVSVCPKSWARQMAADAYSQHSRTWCSLIIRKGTQLRSVKIV